MNKTRLQELCHRKRWNPPEYSTRKDGPPHNPTFTATVTVGGLSFPTDHPARSAKEAQSNAAGLAIQYLTDPKPPPLADSLSAITDVKNIPATKGTSQPEIQATSQSHQAHEAFLVTRDDKKLDSSSASNIVNNVPATKGTLQVQIQETCQTPEGMQHLYKTQLQTYAQKRNLPLPMYSFESIGPSHNCRFKSKVTIEGQTYESPDFFPTLKDAEHAAAKLALMSLSPAGFQEDDYGVYKNLLQEMARKEGYQLPVYSTEKSGVSHMPTFLSTVEIEGETFEGQKAKTKKLAEMNAAKAAYTCLKERK
ncbi:double-stranded RNA-binding protein 1-like [Vitis riparia]|uniref:double-stranded RNA-binding protein 1-like n=1 Tax=Vitis riparia TaxID=96939 RepID=UPI00155A1A02|nr:double-stranded RNA-binding protein 1-like [Vitis riparia]